MNYTIQLNLTGTHTLDLTDRNLETLRRYGLLNHLVDSTGYINQDVVDKLRLNTRALVEQEAADRDLLDLCFDVIYHDRMKAYGLRELIRLYTTWIAEHPEPAPEQAEEVTDEPNDEATGAKDEEA